MPGADLPVEQEEEDGSPVLLRLELQPDLHDQQVVDYVKSQPTVCICPYYKSRVLMRMENLSTLEKDNSNLISMANKWLFS